MKGLSYPFPPRQKQLLSLLATGVSQKEISRRLQLSYSSIRTHANKIATTTGYHGNALIVFAVRWADAQRAAQ